MGVKPHFLFSLGRHSKQAADERDLTGDVPFFHTMHLLCWLLGPSVQKGWRFRRYIFSPIMLLFVT